MSLLADALETFDEDRLTALLAARPDLLEHSTRLKLVQAAGQERSIEAALDELTLPARQVAEALHLLGHRASFDEVCAVDPSADPAVLAAAVDELRTLLLVTGPDEELVLVRPAERHLPSPLGFGRRTYLAHETTGFYDLVEILGLHGEPRQRSGEAARRALGELFADTVGLLDRIARNAPPALMPWLVDIDARGPVVRVPGLDLLNDKLPDDPGLHAALAAGLVVEIGPGRVELPFEVGVAVRHPGFARYDLAPAVLAAADAEGSAAAAASAVQALLDGVDAVVARLPVPLLPSGGLGVKELRGLSSVGLPLPAVALVLELLRWAGLVDKTRKDLRATKEWDAWSAGDDASRWTTLVQAWCDDPFAPAAAPDSERRASMALSYSWDDRARDARRQLVRVLALHRDRSGTTEQWLRAWHCRFPERRLSAYDRRGHVVDREFRRDVLFEAEVLGLLAAGSGSPLLQALYDGADVAAVLSSLSDAGEEHVKAQADLTLICTGRPSRTMRAALDRIADVESAAQATVWRVSEGSLGRAFSEGDTAEQVQFVLERYASPVPQPMAYLVKDAHRRYQPVTVGSAVSWVVADDERLVEALGRRGAAAKAAKAVGLVRIAPGVAVSRASQEATIAALKVLGLHASTSSVGAAKKPRAATPVRRRVSGGMPVFDVTRVARAAAQRLSR